MVNKDYHWCEVISLTIRNNTQYNAHEVMHITKQPLLRKKTNNTDTTALKIIVLQLPILI